MFSFCFLVFNKIAEIEPEKKTSGSISAEKLSNENVYFSFWGNSAIPKQKEE